MWCGCACVWSGIWGGGGGERQQNAFYHWNHWKKSIKIPPKLSKNEGQNSFIVKWLHPQDTHLWHADCLIVLWSETCKIETNKPHLLYPGGQRRFSFHPHMSLSLTMDKLMEMNLCYKGEILWPCYNHLSHFVSISLETVLFDERPEHWGEMDTWFCLTKSEKVMCEWWKSRLNSALR